MYNVRGASSGIAGSKEHVSGFRFRLLRPDDSIPLQIDGTADSRKMGLFHGLSLIEWSDADCSATRSSFDLGIGLGPRDYAVLELCLVTHLP